MPNQEICRVCGLYIVGKSQAVLAQSLGLAQVDSRSKVCSTCCKTYTLKCFDCNAWEFTTDYNPQGWLGREAGQIRYYHVNISRLHDRGFSNYYREGLKTYCPNCVAARGIMRSHCCDGMYDRSNMEEVTIRTYSGEMSTLRLCIGGCIRDFCPICRQTRNTSSTILRYGPGRNDRGYICHVCRCTEASDYCDSCNSYFSTTQSEVCPCSSVVLDEDIPHVLRYHGGKRYQAFLSRGAISRVPKKNTLYLGVELEVQSGSLSSHSFDSIAINIHRDSNRVWTSEYDSSIESGFELVSRAATPDLWREGKQVGKVTKEMLRYLRKEGFKSHNATCSCGMHVSVSGSELTPFMRYKIFRQILDNRNAYIYISQRRITDLTRWADIPEHLEVDLIDRCKRKTSISCNGKYIFANSSPNRVEFRLFRGNLRFDRFMKNVECVKALVDWSRSVKLEHCSSKESFFLFVLDREEEYPHFCKYLNENFPKIEKFKDPTVIIGESSDNEEDIEDSSCSVSPVPAPEPEPIIVSTVQRAAERLNRYTTTNEAFIPQSSSRADNVYPSNCSRLVRVPQNGIRFRENLIPVRYAVYYVNYEDYRLEGEITVERIFWWLYKVRCRSSIRITRYAVPTEALFQTMEETHFRTCNLSGMLRSSLETIQCNLPLIIRPEDHFHFLYSHPNSLISPQTRRNLPVARWPRNLSNNPESSLYATSFNPSDENITY